MGTHPNSNVVIQLSGECMGRGDDVLGYKLIKSFLNVLTETDITPTAIVLFNTGVKLACEGSEVIDVLRDMERGGVKLLCCGTCLNHFELKEKRLVGVESNMYDITNTMLQADKVVAI